MKRRVYLEISVWYLLSYVYPSLCAQMMRKQYKIKEAFMSSHTSKCFTLTPSAANIGSCVSLILPRKV